MVHLVDRRHMIPFAFYSICVGRDVANQMLFIFLASIIWAFKIEKAVDACGNPITPAHGDLDLMDAGIVVYVSSMRCCS